LEEKTPVAVSVGRFEKKKLLPATRPCPGASTVTVAVAEVDGVKARAVVIVRAIVAGRVTALRETERNALLGLAS